MDGHFTGQLAFVTGAANGIGCAAAVAFAGEGAFEDWTRQVLMVDRVFNLNVKALILATQAAALLFPAAGGIVVKHKFRCREDTNDASPSVKFEKGAVDFLTRGLALELGSRRLRVLGIASGLTATEGTSGTGEQTTG